MNTEYILVPIYTVYIVGALFVLLILIVLCLVYLLAYKRCRRENSYNLRISVREDVPVKHKITSFHLPKITFENKFKKLHAGSVESVQIKQTNEKPAVEENQSDQTKSYIERVKEKIPDPIVSPEKMAEIVNAINNKNNLKVNFRKMECFEKGFEIRNEVVCKDDRKSRKSFRNSQNKCASVPDLGIYDVITTVRPIERNRSSESVYYAATQDRGKVLNITNDRNSDYYKFPLMLRSPYAN